MLVKRKIASGLCRKLLRVYCITKLKKIFIDNRYKIPYAQKMNLILF
nr:MAG TPA: hypothetical protein [Caudoviricetes sp.]